MRTLAEKNTYRKEWRKRNPEKVKQQNSRDNFKWSLKTHGLTIDQYNQLYYQQGGVCAICQKKSTDKILCIDHNHATGKVRGLLCRLCNMFIGRLDESPDKVKLLLQYLDR